MANGQPKPVFYVAVLLVVLGLVGRRRQAIAQRPQDVGHAVGIVDIHLAPIGADEHALALPV